jgi:hypothetical protein
MNNLVTYADFTGDRNIPNLEKDIASFNTFITTWQKEILIKLLGYDLYLAFETALAGTPETKWTDLIDGSTYAVSGVTKRNPGLKDIIAYYVYCKWVQVNFNNVTGIGVINATSDNAVKVDPEFKIMSAWNNMLNYYYMVYSFISENETDYPNCEFTELKLMTYGF